MLENFFDIRKDSKELFEGLEIMENPALCKKCYDYLKNVEIY